MDQDSRIPVTAAAPAYSPAARRFHWWTVALIAVQVPVGFFMAYRGGVLDIWDALTNNLYSAHKLTGIAMTGRSLLVGTISTARGPSKPRRSSVTTLIGRRQPLRLTSSRPSQASRFMVHLPAFARPAESVPFLKSLPSTLERMATTTFLPSCDS